MTGEFVRVSLRVPLAQAEEARAAAIELAPGGFEESEAGDTLILGLYVDESAVEAIRAAFADVDVTPVEPGWEDAWRAFHRPARAGGLWIGPPWEQPDPGEPAVVIDPGRAFGTGAHPTTRLCIELLATSERGSLLDVGCGSGVLSIAASRLGFDPILAVDNDPVAIETTIANAAANGVVLEASPRRRGRRAPACRRRRCERAAAPVERILARLDTRSAITSGYLAAECPWRQAGGRSNGSSSTVGRRIGSSAARSVGTSVPYASGIGTIGSPTRIVPPVTMSARSPPRCTRPASTPAGASLWRWEHGSASRRPTHSTSPTLKR